MVEKGWCTSSAGGPALLFACCSTCRTRHEVFAKSVQPKVQQRCKKAPAWHVLSCSVVGQAASPLAGQTRGDPGDME